MPAWNFRRIQASDDDAIRRVYQVVYNGNEPLPLEEPMLAEGEWGIVGEKDGVIGAAMYVWPLKLTRGETRWKTGGVAAVGVMPEHRTGGLGADMMSHSMREMRDEGCLMTALYAYKESFYRKCGYVTAGVRWRISVPNHRLPDWKGSIPVRQISPEDVHLVKPCYDAFIEKHCAGNDREQWQWKNRLGQKPPLIYAAGDPIEAYAWFHLNNKFWDDVEIGEFIWTTQRGYESILAFMRGIMANRTNLNWYEPSSSPYLASYLDQGVEMKLNRSGMFRALDVPGLLSSLRASQSGSFSIGIVDPIVPENNGPWLVEFDAAGTRVSQSSSADVTVSIERFTQMVLGEPSIDDLVRMDLVSVPAPKLADLRSLMPPSPVYLTEFF
jgi:predicted acetyltransferase